MNKSKFLKKSLALLLAFMLVFAMIPLGAAAAEALPDFDRLYVNGIPVTVEGDTFSADIPRSSSTVGLQAAAGSLGTGDFTSVLKVFKGDTVMTENITDASEANVNLANWDSDTSDDTVTIMLRLEHSTKPADLNKEFKLVLTLKDAKTTATLESATPDQNTGAYTATIDKENCVVTVEVARMAGSTTATNPKVVLKAADNAVIDFTGATGTPGNTVTLSGNTVLVDNTHFTITSASGGNISEWVLKVVKVDSLKTFSIGGVAGVISDSDADNVPDTVTVRLPESMLKDSHGDALTAVRLPVDFSVNGNVASLELCTSSQAQNAGTSVKPDSVYNFGNLGTTKWTGAAKGKLFVPSGTGDAQEYALVIDVEKSSDTEITYAEVDGHAATIEGKTISVVLPSKKQGTATDTNLAAVTVTFETGDKVQSLTLDNSSGTTASDAAFADASANGKKTWTKSGATVNLSTPKIVTVTAEDGTVKTYTISAKISDNDKVAQLTALTIGDYKGEIKANKDVVFTVPYMTLDIGTLPVYATTNEDATATIYNTTNIRNGQTQAKAFTASGAAFPLSAAGDRTTKGDKVLRVVNKNNADNWNDYNIVIQLEAPKTGKTLTSSGLTVSAQTVTPVGAKNYTVADRVTKNNTFTASVSTDLNSKTGKVILKPAFSLSSEVTTGSIWNVITDIQTNNGGVAFLGIQGLGTDPNFYIQQTGHKWQQTYTDGGPEFGTPGMISVLADNADSFASSGFFNRYTYNGGTDNVLKILVLPEEYARQLKIKLAATNDVSSADAGVADIIAEGVIYTVTDEPQKASSACTLSDFTVKGTKLTVNNSTFEITGTLPYNATATTPSAGNWGNAQFIDFTISDYAQWANFCVKGDENNDGYYDDAVGAQNKKLIFVRNSDHTVAVYETSADTLANTATAIADITIEAEDRLDANKKSSKKYTFKLRWADPNTEAKLTGFAIGNSTGTINADRQVSVVVPFGTDLKSLIPTFTTSSGATVELINGTEIESGKATLDFSNPVKVTVKSEDGLNQEEYVITVTASDKFTDVPESAWYYEEVMKAADLGLVTGKGNGIFAPMENVKRGDFALMIARMENGGEEGWKEVEKDYATSAFPDTVGKYYSAAVAYCAQKGYVSGNSDGTFNGDRPIKREEMAKFMCNVAGLKEVTSPSANFADDASISNWAKGFVYAASEAGLMNGVGGNKFAPKSTTPRCQAAAALVRYTESK